MRRIRLLFPALFALLAAPSASRAQPDTGAATTTYAASPADPAAGASLPARAAPPRTLRAYWHVFIAFAVAWGLLFGYVVLIARRSRRLEEQLDGLSRP